MEDLIHERQAIEFYLRHHKKEDSQAEKLFFTDGYQELLAPHLKPISQELQEWAAQAYDSNPKYKEQLIFKTPSGHKVRSNSEVLIALYLYTHKIPFRYEAPLTISEIMLYPDFTIRHPQTGKYFFWEHFGMIDDPAYCKKCIQSFSSTPFCSKWALLRKPAGTTQKMLRMRVPQQTFFVYAQPSQ